jgi:hypothetical protein
VYKSISWKDLFDNIDKIMEFIDRFAKEVNQAAVFLEYGDAAYVISYEQSQDNAERQSSAVPDGPD